MNNKLITDIVYVYDYGRNVGGINPIVTKCANLLSKNYNVHVCTADAIFDGFDDKVNTISLSDACAHNRGEGQRAINSILNIKAGWLFNKLLKKLDPEKTIVHFHGWGMGLSASVVMVAKKRGFKCIYTAHDYSLGCPNGVYYRFDRNENCQLQPMSLQCISTPCDKKGKIVKTQRIVRKTLERSMINPFECFDRVIAVSNAVENVLLGYGVSEEIITVIRNPYDISEYSSLSNTVVKRDKFVFIGRLELEKGVLDFCEAIQTTGLSGKIIGDGALLNFIRQKYPSIVCTGWIDADQIAQELQDSKCLVLPSRWREPSALVVEEAISAGLQVIVPSETGAEEKITKDIGYVFEIGDLVSLTGCMRVADSRIGTDGINPSELGFVSFNVYVDELTAIYNDIFIPRRLYV